MHPHVRPAPYCDGGADDDERIPRGWTCRRYSHDDILDGNIGPPAIAIIPLANLRLTTWAIGNPVAFFIHRRLTITD
jgi:hypothetical protein